MYFKHSRRLPAKLLLLLVALIVVGLISFGCVEGLRPIGWSGGMITGDTLFVGSKEGKLVAINIVDESRQFSVSLKTAKAAPGFGCMPVPGEGCAAGPSGVAIYGTPVVSGDLVYIGGYNGKIYAFNSSSLAMRWVYPRESYLEPIVGGPLVAQGKVFVGDSDGNIYALDAATGDLQWEFETGDKIWSSPAIEGDTLFVGSYDNKLYALDATDGRQKWEFEAEGAFASTPLVYNNTVYAGSFDRHLYAIDADSGNLRWKFMSENWFWAKPIIYNDTVYAGSLDGKVYALKAGSGNKVAEFNLGSPISSSPVIVDSSIIFASRNGAIYALETANNALKQLADIEEDVYGPLVASEEIVYIHTQDLTLHRVNTNTGAILISISLESK